MSGTTRDRHPLSGSRRRSPWLYATGAAVLTSSVVAAVVTLTPIGVRDRIQHDLTERSEHALYAAGVPEAQVRFSGRDVTLYDIPTGQDVVAVRAVETVSGVRAVRIQRAEPVAATSNEVPGPFAVTADKDRATLTGSVVDQATKDLVLAAARQQAGGREVVDRMAVGEADGGGWSPVGAVGVLGAAVAPGVGVVLDGLDVTLTGAVPTDLDKATAEQRVRAAAPGANVHNELTVQRPGIPVAPADLQRAIDAAAAARPVTFEPHTATLTPAAHDTVVQIAELAKAAPQLRIELAGTEDRTGMVRDVLGQAGLPVERVVLVPGDDTVRFAAR